MRQFIINIATGIVKFETKIPYTLIDGETLVETDDLSTLIFPEIVIQPLSEISPAEFRKGLFLQNILDADVLDFIDNHIEDAVVQFDARNMYVNATSFEFKNELLNNFIGAFNQYLQLIGKQELNFNQLFT